jgi:hypothetical protein
VSFESEKFNFYKNFFPSSKLTGSFYSVESQRIDGTDRKMLLSNINGISGLAYDWVSSNLYLSSYASQTIAVYKLSDKNETMKKTIINNSTMLPG